MIMVVKVDVVTRSDHYGGMNHTKPYCWVKYTETEYVHQVIDGVK